MSEKKKLIQEMIAMQKKFIAQEHANGMDPEEYYSPTEGTEMEGYQSKYTEMANRLVEMAHEEKGSKR
jgi:hypothetical protein